MAVVKRMWAALAAAVVVGSAHADLSVMLAVEPTARRAGLAVARETVETGLARAANTPARLTTSDDLAEVLRATRSGSHDVFIGPAQIAASALQRGYELVGSTAKSERFVLVGKETFRSPDALRDGRIYLPQQDSIYTYMARGMLNENGLSLRDLRTVQYERIPQAGLTALMMGSYDATVVLQSDWEAWEKLGTHIGTVLATSKPVPGGFTVVVKKDLPADVRARIAAWFVTPPTASGLMPASTRADAREFKTVAELALFTPANLPGALVVTSDEVRRLQAAGAVVVDTRTEKEFAAKHIPGAVLAPYVEKSLKDVVFDPKLDDYSAVAALNKAASTIFACNGAECWKSYKAARAALASGFTKVYWFRGGLPEWEAAGLPTQARTNNAQSAVAGAR